MTKYLAEQKEKEVQEGARAAFVSGPYVEMQRAAYEVLRKSDPRLQMIHEIEGAKVELLDLQILRDVVRVSIAITAPALFPNTVQELSSRGIMKEADLSRFFNRSSDERELLLKFNGESLILQMLIKDGQSQAMAAIADGQ